MKYIALSISAIVALWWHFAAKEPQTPTTSQTTKFETTHSQPVIVKPVLSQKTLADIQQRPIAANINQQLPSSLQDTPTPQQLRIDEHGFLIIEPEIINLFDYYLTAIGEEDITLIVDRIKHQLATSLQSPALDQALELLNHYLDYRNQRQQLLNDHYIEALNVAQLGELKSQIKSLRANLFGSSDIPLFQHQDQYDDHMLARQTIANDNQLSEAQKQQALEALIYKAPEWLFEQQQADNRINHYLEQKQQLDSYSLDQLAEQQFGIAAAQRLTQLRQKRQQWQQKLDSYHQQLAVILINVEDQTLKHQQITALRAQFFNQNEQLRVGVIDRQKFEL